MDLNLNQTPFQQTNEIKIPQSFYNRIKTGIPQLDNLFSGGLVRGTTFTLSAVAGTGKSRLIFQTLNSCAKQGYRGGVAGCEESVEQMAFTCQQMKLDGIQIANISDVDTIAMQMPNFDFLVIDSYQGLKSKRNLGSKLNEQYCLETIIYNAKKNICTTGIICHSTKTGEIKGSSDVLHDVDAIVNIDSAEKNDDPNTRYIKVVKNRFGCKGELVCRFDNGVYNFEPSFLAAQESTDKSKKNKRAQLWQEVLNLSSDITLKSVLPFVNGNLMYANNLLREMIANELITKEGRGNDAIYERVDEKEKEKLYRVY